VTVANGAAAADSSLWAFLTQMLGEPIVLGASVNQREPHRKPLFQAATLDGRTLAYVKLGWNAATRNSIDVEAAALAQRAEAVTRLVVPKVIHHGSWAAYRVLVTAPLPIVTRRYRERRRPPTAAEVRAVLPTGHGQVKRLDGSAYVGTLRRRLATHGGAAASSAVACLDDLTAAAGQVELEFGPWHGDWVPWNLARHGERLLAWDWEFSTDDVPVGFDAVHFHFEIEATARGSSARRAAEHAVAGSDRVLDSLGLGARQRETVVILYLLEILARRLDIMEESTRGRNGFVVDLAEVISTHTRRLAPPSASVSAGA
jgi:hypothetical protein